MLGGLFVVLGPLPTWLLDKQVLSGLYGNRFALAAMPGLSLLFIVLIQNLISSHRTQAAILAILVALATGFHLRTGNDFRNIWEKQRNFYWQLAWRAPGLEAPTNLLADGELFSYVGSYSTSTALNLLYMPPVQTRTLGYWFVDLQDSFSRSTGFWLSGRSVNGLLRAFTYEGNSLDSLVFTYEPEAGQCLWLLDAADSADILLTTTTRDALDLSNLSRILDQPAADHLPPEEIFGPEPERTWCTIFQAASLAAQRKNWQAVLALEEEAALKGLHPNNPRELLPFVQAHAYTLDWDGASQLTLQILRIEPKYERLLCAKWAVFFTETPDSPDRQEAQNKILTRMTCDF
jgi:hypothetical protein